MPAVARRLAGIHFVDVPPALPEKLPRMDIAVFVGFASAGPLHTPVAIEDAAQFNAWFGDDLPLAWDPLLGELVTAQLGPATRAFFRNGGRRCWVIRVAGRPQRDGADDPNSAPETNAFPIPGLIRIDAGTLQPAFARARSPGTWFDGFQTATALTTRPLRLLRWSTTALELAVSGVPAVRPGDVIRLSFATDAAESFFRVKSLAEIPASPPRSRSEQISVGVEFLGHLRWLTADELLGGSPFQASWARRPGHTETTSAEVFLEDSSPPEGAIAARLGVAPGFVPPPGSLLQLSAGATPLYFLVDQVDAKPVIGSPPTELSELIGRAFEFSATPPTDSFFSPPVAERLSFDLRVRRGSATPQQLLDLGFVTDHPRCWNALPSDDAVFGPLAPGSELRSRTAEAHAELVAAASNPRFPLAGDTTEAAFLPIGMRAVFEPWMSAEHSGRAPLVRDGLATFDSALFLDPRLQGTTVASLLPEADFLRYQLRGAPPLRGLHAALGVEEATLIAVPDATHRSWQPTDSSTPPSPLPSEPVPHPRWWHFLPCNPPATPPAPVAGPERGQFLDCGLRVVATPVLSEVDGPEASGTYRVRWTSPDADAVFVLEEASRADFGDAIELARTRARQHTFLAREPGVYYHRVRAEAEGESSDWSNGVVVHIGVASRWELEDLAQFADDSTLEVHRSLLRLCAARADLVAVLSLPGHWREDDTLAYAATLKSGRVTNEVLPLGDGENRAFSYAALYHPWVLVRESDAPATRRPPDGTVLGAMARRTIARGAWIAPANDPLTGALGLEPKFARERQLDVLLAQVNLLRQEPSGILVLSADTLSDDPELRPLNVRRLLILLRRAALRLGHTYVFEPNDLTLRRVVRGAFESMLQQLFMRGAFAGATADASYRVVVDEPLNNHRTADRGEFFVELKVAPALPMSFLTIRLVQVGEHAKAVELI